MYYVEESLLKREISMSLLQEILAQQTRSLFNLPDKVFFRLQSGLIIPLWVV